MQILSSLLELAGLVLAGLALYRLGGAWLVALALGVILTATGFVLGRPVPDESRQ